MKVLAIPYESDTLRKVDFFHYFGRENYSESPLAVVSVNYNN